MAKKRETPHPTHAELEILRVLWRREDSTVREVHEDLVHNRDVGYTTVLKLMQIMADKGLVTRDASARTHVYRAAVTEDDTKRRIVSDLLDRAFEGSALGLVMHALATRPAPPDEIKRIRALLDDMKPGERK
jgi:BlaI family transcriptional regulator, penicillinase repressor